MTDEFPQWQETPAKHEAFTYFSELITNSPDGVAIINTPTRRYVICTFNHFYETENKKNPRPLASDLKNSSVCVSICPLRTDPNDVTSPSASYPPLETLLIFNQVTDDFTTPLWIVSNAQLSIRVPGVGFVKGSTAESPHRLRVPDRREAENVGNTLVNYLKTYGVRSSTAINS